ncbi:hypothetical protein OF83DRAFT_1179345 [Amylostereum chailletii]|nr:hypothetical protein OF83DRAFT_1179345 [Amylostereum chailletii]
MRRLRVRNAVPDTRGRSLDLNSSENEDGVDSEESGADHEDSADDEQAGARKKNRRNKEASEEDLPEEQEEEDVVPVVVSKLKVKSRGHVGDPFKAVVNDEDKAIPVVVNKPKGKLSKGGSRSQVDAVRRATTGSATKSVPEKRSAPDDARGSSTKVFALNLPPSKKARPIGGLNSHWTPTPGRRGHQAERPSSPSPEHDPFDEGSDGGKFEASAPPMLKLKTTTPRPRPHTGRTYKTSQPSDFDLDEDEDIVDNDRKKMTPTAASSTAPLPPKQARVFASNTRIPKVAVRQDTNPLTQVSAPVVAKLGPKSRQAIGTAKHGRKPRWTTDALDKSIHPSFNNVFMSKVREFTGTLLPWLSPSVDEVQTLFDEMYPGVDLTITRGEVVFDLTIQQLKEWRSMIGSEALNNLKMYLEADVDPDAEVDSEARASFATAAAYIEWVLHSEDDKNVPMYWARWNGGVGKEGRFQFHLILKTLLAHLATIPSDSKEHPSGALILCILAIECALRFSLTGSQVIPRGPQGHFSLENWGDKTVRTNEGNIKLRRKAGKFVPTVDGLSANNWLKILAGALKWLDKPSDIEYNDVIEESDVDSDFMMTSDAPPSDSDESDDAWPALAASPMIN